MVSECVSDWCEGGRVGGVSEGACAVCAIGK